jgi:hypothetical protein
MPLIPYPDVPAYPGVPQLVRSAASSTVVNIALSAVGSALLGALQSQQQWGIYTSAGAQLGGASGLSLLSSLVSQPTVLSTVAVDYMKEMIVSSFPIEGGGFANYNKVERPGNPVVTLSLTGSVTDRNTFLTAIDTACKSTNTYNVVTPEFTYVNYTIERYSLRRSAEKGANLITVEIALQEVRQVSAAFSTVTPNPIANPQTPGAASQVNSGNVQPTAPDVSALSSVMSALGVTN